MAAAYIQFKLKLSLELLLHQFSIEDLTDALTVCVERQGTDTEVTATQNFIVEFNLSHTEEGAI